MARHVPVLLREVVDLLQLKPGMQIIDCTLGDGGHSEAMLAKTAPSGKLLGIDADPESLLRAKQYLYQFGDRLVAVRDNFSNLEKIVAETNFGPADAILMDFGWSSPQFSERGRGFSFEKDEPLDMRYAGAQSMGQSATAAEILETYTKDELRKIFKQYGEENLSAEIAAALVEKRKASLVSTTKQLTDIVLEVYRAKLHSDKEVPWIGGIHPATKVFQALRIAVNKELAVIEQALPQAVAALAPGGRLAVITFHSLEDRIVKHFFQKNSDVITVVNKKPIVAGESELAENPRSRSAKLRVVQKN